jgi:hypothetical protein
MVIEALLSVLKGTTFFGFSDVAVNHPAPTKAALLAWPRPSSAGSMSDEWPLPLDVVSSHGLTT